MGLEVTEGEEGGDRLVLLASGSQAEKLTSFVFTTLFSLVLAAPLFLMQKYTFWDQGLPMQVFKVLVVLALPIGILAAQPEREEVVCVRLSREGLDDDEGEDEGKKSALERGKSARGDVRQRSNVEGKNGRKKRLAMDSQGRAKFKITTERSHPLNPSSPRVMVVPERGVAHLRARDIVVKGQRQGGVDVFSVSLQVLGSTMEFDLTETRFVDKESVEFAAAALRRFMGLTDRFPGEPVPEGEEHSDSDSEEDEAGSSSDDSEEEMGYAGVVDDMEKLRHVEEQVAAMGDPSKATKDE
jgi:hypothetical protein